MKISHAYYLIIDLEATCSNQNEVPRHEMEIIEIGAVALNATTFEIESEFQTFIRPVRHPELTDFCKELTGITQDQVDSAPLFPEALNAMARWKKAYDNSLFCSWGDYDRNQFAQDCSYHGVDYPFKSGHMNLKAEFSLAFGLKKKLGISPALSHLCLEFEGSPHRGIDDAKNIARIVRRIMMRP